MKHFFAVQHVGTVAVTDRARLSMLPTSEPACGSVIATAVMVRPPGDLGEEALALLLIAEMHQRHDHGDAVLGR